MNFIHVDVVDAGGENLPRLRDDESGESGRGLQIVEMLAHRWDVRQNATGRTVWFQVQYERTKGIALPLPRQRESPESDDSTVKEATGACGDGGVVGR
ncbi:ATP-binding protein [Sphaerisporangium fuscum]|uniref:ATP-binding protein n=1 Tax=Sphaerisporangium fuscum TaxID=2835868 RepID=UPI001BDC1609|nr:ATP-binding protein [Sphaerisporangium fuscum]